MASIRTLATRFGQGRKGREALESIYICVNPSASVAAIIDFDESHLRKAIAKRIIRNWSNSLHKTTCNALAQAIEDLIGMKRGQVHRLIKQCTINTR